MSFSFGVKTTFRTGPPTDLISVVVTTNEPPLPLHYYPSRPSAFFCISLDRVIIGIQRMLPLSGQQVSSSSGDKNGVAFRVSRCDEEVG